MQLCEEACDRPGLMHQSSASAVEEVLKNCVRSKRHRARVLLKHQSWHHVKYDKGYVFYHVYSLAIVDDLNHYDV